MQRTEKYFEQDAFRTECESVILAAEPDEKTGGGRIALDGTVFYPEGGGQPADRGTLTLPDGTVLRVSDVHEQAGIIWHTVDVLPAAAAPGAAVAGCIDWDWRFDKMQQHTGEHILSGILHQMFGAENVGFHVGTEVVRMDTSVPISPEGLRQAELAANRIVWQDVPVLISYPTREELAALVYRSKKEIEGQVRIVTIPGADVCACCGTHTRTTGQVGQIKILASENYKGGVRLSVVCGARALAAAQAKSTFLATMSHELRSPLNAVIGFSELLSDGSLPPQEFREYISGINYAGKNLLALINNILDYSKLESEQMKIVAAPTDFNELLNKLKAVFRLSAEDKGLELNFLCRPLPGLILDAYRVRQILTNLLSNAIKFTENGQVQVLVSYESGTLKIAVSDTGRGVDKDFQRKIFEPFYQQENSDATCIGGTGLGLVISKKLAEQMHGYIQLVSEPGFGSTFTLVLPDVPAVAETADSTPRELPDMTGCRGMDILIVDDSPINLKILEAMFRKIQLPVRKAASGAAALEAMKEKTADVVFTDLRMPEMNGSELARIIRRNPAWNRVRVVAITADIMFNEEQKAVFDAVLLKPISLEQLFTLLYRFSKSA